MDKLEEKVRGRNKTKKPAHKILVDIILKNINSQCRSAKVIREGAPGYVYGSEGVARAETALMAEYDKKLIELLNFLNDIVIPEKAARWVIKGLKAAIENHPNPERLNFSGKALRLIKELSGE